MASWVGVGSGVVRGLPQAGAASLALHFLLPLFEMSTVWGAGAGIPPRSEL